MDNVNKPNHYILDGIPGVEVKDVIKAVLGEDIVGFYLGNVLKYMLRFKKKNGLEDLKKARLYLDWAIEDYGEDIPSMLRRLEMKKNPVKIAEQLDFFDDIYEECASCSRKNCRNYKMNSKADTVFITRNVPNCKICKKNEKK